MIHYISKTFTASVRGSRLEAVVCEQCGTRFAYELVRVGVGSGSAPYYLGQKSAARRAERGAQKDLARRLARDAELVPCPKCRWVNQELVGRYRRRLYRRAPLLVGVIVIAGLIAGPLLTAGLTQALGSRSTTPRTVALAVMGFCLLSPVWVLLIRRSLRQWRVNPNRSYPRRPVLPPGTPPALVERRDPRTGRTVLEPVPHPTEEYAGRREAGATWAVFRPGQVEFPRVCCACLEPASTTYSSPFKVNDRTDFAVPLCRACSRRLRRRWWLLALVIAAAVTGLAWLAKVSIHGSDDIGRWMVFVLIEVFGVPLFVAVVPNLVCQPYRWRAVDADRGVVRFAARNPAYTALLVEQANRADGIVGR